MRPSKNPVRSRAWNPWRLAGWGAAAALWLAPWVAMQFTPEVDWGPADFAFAFVLLAVVGVACELAVRRTANRFYRAAAAMALATASILVWANAAVGIIGNEDNPANRMYWVVLAVGLLGAVAARWRPRGMAWALVATAMAQALVAGIAQLAGWGRAWPITLFFAALWLASAWLFRQAADRPRPPDAAP
jgi:hypothetical protein